MNKDRDRRNVFFTEFWFEFGQHKRWVWRRHDDYSADFWEGPTLKTINSLVDEMPRMLRQVQKEGGRTIRHPIGKPAS
jgi:hypothetical protein